MNYNNLRSPRFTSYLMKVIQSEKCLFLKKKFKIKIISHNTENRLFLFPSGILYN